MIIDLNNFDKKKVKIKSSGERDINKRLISSIYKSCDIPKCDYKIFFMNNLEEMYNTLLLSITNSFRTKTGLIPHIILNAMEPVIILDIVEKLCDNKLIDITYVQPNIFGCINSNEIERHIMKNTCLIIKSSFNQYFGSKNNLNAIGGIAHKHGIPVMSDLSFTFVKYPISPHKNNIDIIICDFDKLGLPNLISIIIDNRLIDGYGIELYNITDYTDTNYGASAFKIIENNYYNRKDKNKKIAEMNEYFLNKLRTLLHKNSNLYYYEEILKNKISCVPGDIVIFGHSNNYIPHILSFIIVNDYDNIDIKKKMETKKVYINAPISKYDIFSEMFLTPKYSKKIYRAYLFDTIKKKDIREFFSIMDKLLNK